MSAPDHPSTSPTLSPVILVPGLVGSVIRGRRTVHTQGGVLWCLRAEWSRLWLEPSLLLPSSKGCLLRALELHFNVSSGTYSDTPGVQIDPYVDWGGVGGVAYLDPGLGPLASLTGYFSALVEALIARGFTPGTNLHGAPYDWRLAPDAHMAPGGYYDRLRLLIQTSVNRSAGRRAWIVAHSLGCPTISAFLSIQSDAWLWANIEGLVALAGVWAGGASMAMAMVSGDNFGLPLVPLDYVRLVQRMSASGAWMLPAFSAFGDSVPLVRTPGRNYTASPASLLGMLRDLGLDQPAAMYDQLRRRRLSLDDLPPPRVRTAVLAGVGLRTERSFEYARPFSRGFGDPPDGVEYGDGDGSVNAESARVPQERWPADGTHNYTFRYLQGVSHFGIVREEAVLLEVLELMNVPKLQGGWGVGWAAMGFGGALVALRWASGGALSTALV